jgi:NADH-quinone oxidoreductase subunit H
LFERHKEKIAKQAKIVNASEPNFPVPAIPNSRAEQLNG